MKELEIAKIISDVRVNLDEIGLDDSNFEGGADELDHLIRSKLTEALLYAYSNADPKLLDDSPKMVKGISTIADKSAGCCIVTIPSDRFLRLRYAVMESWPHPVSEPIFWPSREYSRLKNPITTGTWERPEVGILPNSFTTESGQVNYTIVELYGPMKSGEQYAVSYVERPQEVNEFTKSVAVPENIRVGMEYYLTGLVMVILSDDRAQAMMQQAATYLGIPLKESRDD